MDRTTTATGPAEKHRRAVSNTLGWADASAASGDYLDAIAWLDMLTAIGDELPIDYRIKRAAWRNALQRQSGGYR